MLKPTSFSIVDLMTLARERLDQSVAIATNAEAQAVSGHVDSAVSAVMGTEQLLYEAGTLVNAASLINRITNEETSQN